MENTLFQIFIINLLSPLFDLRTMISSLQVNIGGHRHHTSLVKLRCNLILLLHLFLVDLLKLVHERIIFALFINQLGNHVLEVLRDFALAELGSSRRTLGTSTCITTLVTLLCLPKFSIDYVLLWEDALKRGLASLDS